MRRSAQPPQRFDRSGMLAIEPRAFFELFYVPQGRATERVGSVDVIEISGPLVQRDEMWCESYEAIRARFDEALAGDARAIVLRFDSPGGDASGCFETARALRDKALAAGKPVYAYVDKCCSAAYALASCATHGIAIGETCAAGSIGVLCSRPDYTAQNTARGLRMAFVVSGQRKLDGNPDFPISEAEIAETQRNVDDLAAKFFALLADMRPQLTAAHVASFDGAVFYGERAVGAGLADGVCTFDQLLAIASGGTAMQVLQAKSEYDAARAALEKIAKGSDANATAAKRALAAMAESEPPKEDEGKDEEPASESEDEEPASEESDDDKPAAEGTGEAPAAADSGAAPAASDEPADAGKKPKSEAAQASGSATELALARRVHALEAREAAARDARARRQLLAKRPDFGPEVRAVLTKVPIDALKEAVKTWPVGKVPEGGKRVQAITTVGATRGESQNGDQTVHGRSAMSGAETAAEMDRRMGLTATRFGSRREGSAMIFGNVVAEQPGDSSTGKAGDK